MFTRFFTEIIAEAVKPTKQRSIVRTAFNIPSAEDDVQLPGAYQEPAQSEPNQAGPKARRSLGTTAGAGRTASKSANALQDPRAFSMLNDLLGSDLSAGEPDEVTDLSTEVVTPEDLPSVISNAMSKSGEVVPEWHMVKNLPGYMQQAIRKLGKMVFAQYTRTPIEKIQVLANLQGGGPNSQREMNAIAGWAVENGTKVTTGEIDFSVMPGYKADVMVYNVEGSQLMIVSDDFGQYVYAWPESDSTIGDWTAEKRLK